MERRTTVDDQLWYKDAVIYEVHVRAFHDSTGDGMGDFLGLTLKLDYLHDLGVTAIWLLPFYPSPLKDDGYDIADYTNVHEHYGRLDHFREFLDAAHRRGIKVITELVINHTSDRHPWFQRARRANPGSVERDFYVWSDTPERYPGVRVIFQDFEVSNWTWDPVAKAYYWHRFYSHQPDLNFDNPAVWEAIFPVVDFWFDLGVDGMRLDAVPYLYEREGTGCENLPETHAFLQALRAHVDRKFPNRMFLAEANQWPEDAVQYFGAGNECHMSFHFPLMPRLFMALHQEDRFPILDILAQTPPIPESCQWCLFLRNHDELTLEMVTDEERDYMYRAYARSPEARINLGIRHRLAPLLNNDRRRIELMNALLFSLPGTPVIYYGDEIGMGDNIYLGDRNGVRTPMQWSPDRNAGFSRANPQKLYLPVIIDPEYHYESVNVESQQKNPSSLLWWMKRLIALRKRYKAFGRGSISFLNSENPKVLAFVRRHDEERILIVANLSRFVQHCELDLREFHGLVPEEMIGHSLFPPISELPYLLTLGPHGFYWFTLKEPQPGQRGDRGPVDRDELGVIEVPEDWTQWLFFEEPGQLEAALPAFLRHRRQHRRANLLRACIQRVWPLPLPETTIFWTLLRLEYESGTPDAVLLPLALVAEEEANQLLEPLSRAALVRLAGAQEGLLCDALTHPACGQSLLRAIRLGEIHRLTTGEVAAVPLARFADQPPPDAFEVPTQLIRSERFNTVLGFGDRFMIKTFHRLEEGINPDLEVGLFLSESKRTTKIAPLLGYIEIRRWDGPSMTIAVMHQYVPHQGTAWQLTLDHLSLFFERVATLPREVFPAGFSPTIASVPATIPSHYEDLIGGYREVARRLGEQTAALHRALSSDPTSSAFHPEPFTKLYQRSVYQSLRNRTHHVLTRLSRQLSELPRQAAGLVAQRNDILNWFRRIIERPLSGARIRLHGDYHLAQLLFTGSDFVVIDFEGDPDQTIGERRVKRSPLRDAASMIWSFHQAAHTVVHDLSDPRGRPPGLIRSEDRTALEPWAGLWSRLVSEEFLEAYVANLADSGLLPATPEERTLLLEIYLLDKVLDRIDRDLDERPELLIIPLNLAIWLLEKPTVPST